MFSVHCLVYTRQSHLHFQQKTAYKIVFRWTTTVGQYTLSHRQYKDAQSRPLSTCKLLQDQALFYVKYVSQDILGTARSFKGYFYRYLFFRDGHLRDIKIRSYGG